MINTGRYQKILLFIKIVIIVLLITELYYHFTSKKGVENTKIIYWENRISFLYTILMAILIIYLFLPGTNHNKNIDNGTKFTLFLFAVTLIVKSKWYNFITDSVVFKKIFNK
jgi:hypothetical protein